MVNYLPNAYTPNEEKANAATHGLGAILATLSVFLFLMKSQNLEALPLASCLIFSISLVVMYSVSTLYHLLKKDHHKKLLKVADHASIYVLIAATYTPVIILTMHDTLSRNLLIGMWVLACIGVIFKFFFTGHFRFISTAIYVLMGWAILILGKSFFLAVPEHAVRMIWLGGFFYTFGTTFYLWKKLPYHHAIWHLFVLAGSISHFFAIYLYLI